MYRGYESFRKEVLLRIGVYGSAAAFLVLFVNPWFAVFLVSGVFAGAVNFILLHEFVQKACKSSSGGTAAVRLLRSSALRLSIIGLGAVASAIFSISALAFFSGGFIITVLTVVVSK